MAQQLMAVSMSLLDLKAQSASRQKRSRVSGGRLRSFFSFFMRLVRPVRKSSAMVFLRSMATVSGMSATMRRRRLSVSAVMESVFTSSCSGSFRGFTQLQRTRARSQTRPTCSGHHYLLCVHLITKFRVNVNNHWAVQKVRVSIHTCRVIQPPNLHNINLCELRKYFVNHLCNFYEYADDLDFNCSF